ncbi:unnamed protein product [Orchesella dallaii]|uniref:Uncharacterized protein n=1 Tax=Orchesella dallaii TaxID=48710 RepID=A0ABP1RRI2_9HEXA
MDQSKPNEDHCLHSPSLPENVTAASFNFYNSHYLTHQPENSQCLPPLSHQNSTITVPNIQHYQSQSAPEFAPNVPSQQTSHRHELIYSLSQQQKLLQYQRNYRTQRRQQQPHYQYIRQQLSDIQMIQLPNSQHEQDDPLMNSETQTSIYQTDSINFQSQQRHIQHPLPHTHSAEFTQPPEYTRETRIDDSNDDNLELEGSSNKTAQSLHAENEILSSDKKGLNPQKTPELSAELIKEKDDQISELANKTLIQEFDSIQQQKRVRELNDEVRPKETETTLLQQKYDAMEKVHNNRLSVEKFLRCELQKQNPKAADMVSKITNLKLELDISNKTALALRAQNKILSNANENLNKQVQTLQTETQHQSAKIGTLTEQNLGIKKSLALSKQEVDSIQQQNTANEQVIKMLRIENNELPGLKEKMESLTNLKKMNDDKEELDKEVEGYKKEITSLSYELENVHSKSPLDLKMEELKVERALNGFNDWKAKLKVEVKKLTDENQNLKQKVEMTENLQKRFKFGKMN